MNRIYHGNEIVITQKPFELNIHTMNDLKFDEIIEETFFEISIRKLVQNIVSLVSDFFFV